MKPEAVLSRLLVGMEEPLREQLHALVRLQKQKLIRAILKHLNLMHTYKKQFVLKENLNTPLRKT